MVRLHAFTLQHAGFRGSDAHFHTRASYTPHLDFELAVGVPLAGLDRDAVITERGAGGESDLVVHGSHGGGIVSAFW